jgi:hypothetical protein
LSSARTGSPRACISGLDTLEQNALVDAQLDHRVELEALFGEKPVERLRLRHRAREAIENEPLARIRLADTVGNDGDHHLVGHQFAARHDVLRAQTDRRAGRHRRAQHVAGRQLHDAVLRDQTLRLGTLPRPRRAKQDQPHCRLLLTSCVPSISNV